MDIQKTIRGLNSYGCSTKHFATGAEAADYLYTQINNTTVGIGGSKTVDSLGLYERLCENNDVTWHWKDGKTDEIFRKARDAKVYICSANAVAETGELVFIDGTSNRVSAITSGFQKREYFVVSTKKICPDIQSAIARARSVAPINAHRIPGSRPCEHTDKCVDCRSAARVCRSFLVLCGPVMGQELLEVILVDEDLGL